MSIIITKPEEIKRELIPAGMHQAYLTQVIYLGTQKQEWEGAVKQSQKIRLSFEFPKFMVEYEDKDTKEKKTFARSIGQEFTMSLHPKGKLLPLIQGWLGRNLTSQEEEAFDICEFLGKPALINIVHHETKNGTYENIASVAPVMEGMQLIPRHGELLEIGKAEWFTHMDKLPKFIQEKIKASNEWQSMQNDEIPVIGEQNTINIDDII